MKVKRILLLMLLTIATMAVWAQNTSQAMVVWMTDGTQVRHMLSDEPKTSFLNGTLFLSSNKVSISYPLDQVRKYTFEGEYQQVNISQLRPGEVRMWETKDAVKFEGLEAGTPVEVYNMDGRMLSQQTAQEGVATIASLAEFPTGTYIVKIKNQTIKFLKR